MCVYILLYQCGLSRHGMNSVKVNYLHRLHNKPCFKVVVVVVVVTFTALHTGSLVPSSAPVL